MRTIKLYTGGGASFSPTKRPGSTLSNYVRLVADSGAAITNGIIITTVIDVPKTDSANWSDCEMPPDPPAPDPEITDVEALNIILGGS